MARTLDTVYIARGFRGNRPERDTHVRNVPLPPEASGPGRPLTCTDCGTTFTTRGGQPQGITPCWACVRRRAERVKQERDGSAMKEQRRAGKARKARGQNL